MGCAAARNLGITHSKGDIVISTDADCIVTKGWLSEIVKIFRNKDVGGVAGEVVAYPPKTPAERYAAKVRHVSPQIYLKRPLLPFAAFANLAFRKDVFKKIGLLDEDIPLGESTDFCTRFFRDSGYKFEYAPRAIVFHRHRDTAWAFFKQQFKYGKGHSQLYIKYREEIPWNWRKSLSAYRGIFYSALHLSKVIIGNITSNEYREDINFKLYEFLKKIAERIGFIKESFSRGYFYF